VSEQLLNVLKVCLLALLYIFFFRVLSAVWAEIRAPKAVEAPSGRAAAPSRRDGRAQSARKAAKAAPTVLRVVEPDAQRGRSFPLSDELTVGRAAGCQVTVDDTYVSQLHARVFARDGQLFVEDLGSTNGTYLNRKKVGGPVVMHRGDRLQVGNTVLELA
jgi:pSer/pThr/pTyr-binding forkhead associated (FHA) protein